MVLTRMIKSPRGGKTFYQILEVVSIFTAHYTNTCLKYSYYFHNVESNALRRKLYANINKGSSKIIEIF